MPPPATADGASPYSLAPPLRRFDAARMTGAGLVELQGAEADAKLWAGAAASGWRVVERYANAAKAGKWRYVSPAGYWYQSRGEAFAADARPPPVAPPTPPPAEAEAAAGAGGMPADVVDAKLWDGAAAGGWSVLARGDTHWTYVSPAGERVSSRQQALGIAAAARGRSPPRASTSTATTRTTTRRRRRRSTASAGRTRRTWRRSRWRRWRRRCSPTPTRWR